MKVSVIVPVFNVQDFLEKNINSLLNQNYSDFEVILVNDGSTDNSGEICSYYSKNNPNIVLIEQENGGLPSARNKGLTIAQGEYVMFVDSDDWVDQSYISYMVKCIKDVDFAICGYYVNYQDSEKVISFKNEIITVDQCLPRVLNKEYSFSVWNKIYKKALIDKHSLMFTDVPRGEDQAFNLAYLQYCKRICISDVSLYHYRRRNGQITGVFNPSLFGFIIDSNMHLLSLLEDEKTKKNIAASHYCSVANEAIGGLCDSALSRKESLECIKKTKTYWKKNGYTTKNSALFRKNTKRLGFLLSYFPAWFILFIYILYSKNKA